MEISDHQGYGKVGFVFPVYMGLVPGIVKDFLQSFPVKKDIYYFSVVTYYMYKGIAMSEVRNIFKNKGIKLNYVNSLPTVGNCLMEYEVSENKRKPILEKADNKINIIASDIKNSAQCKKRFCYSILSKWIHKGLFNIFFKEAHKKFAVDDTCISCGKCVKVCPVGNISITDKKPAWEDNCKACHACVHWCPKNAIHIGKSKGRLQYRNPNISYKQLLEMSN